MASVVLKYFERILLAAILLTLSVTSVLAFVDIVVQDFERYTHTQLYSLAAMIPALGICYFLVKRSDLKLPSVSHPARSEL